MFENTFQGPGAGTYTSHTLEILIMLLVAFLLGLLLGYILWSRYKRMYSDLKAEHDALKSAHLELEKDHASLRYQLEQAQNDNATLKQKVRSFEADVFMYKGKIARLEADLQAAAGGEGGQQKMAAAAPTTGKKDDLKKIEGIGPKIEELLNAAGITTFQQLAEASEETLQKILDEAGPNFKLADPGTWKKQAALAAAGNWEELSALQESLKGGREVKD